MERENCFMFAGSCLPWWKTLLSWRSPVQLRRTLLHQNRWNLLRQTPQIQKTQNQSRYITNSAGGAKIFLKEGIRPELHLAQSSTIGGALTPCPASLVLNHGILSTFLSTLSVSVTHVERKSYFPAVVPCSDTVACPDKYTCCKNGSDRWTCCPLEQVDTHTHKILLKWQQFPH